MTLGENDCMTTAEPEDWNGLHERVLGFMGAFSSTQFAIDTVLDSYLRIRMPELGPELEKQFLRRVRDDQRLPLFKAFATQVNYGVDITHFTRIYNRAKQVRDMIGHSQRVDGPVYQVGGPPVVGVSGRRASRGAQVPDPLLPSTFTRLTADCEWLIAHVWRAFYVVHPEAFIDVSGQPTEMPVPAEFPEGGEPLT